MNETKIQAFNRMKLGKASKAELEMLIRWGEEELWEWVKFLDLLHKKLIKTHTTTKI